MDTPRSTDEEGPVHAVLRPAGWPAPRGYAYGIAAEGRLVVTGGVIGWTATGEFPASFVEQAAQAFRNIGDILAEAGAGPRHLVRLTWFVTDMEEYAADLRGLGEAYRAAFGRSYPAMAVVGVSRLLEPKAKLEIEATAVVPI